VTRSVCVNLQINNIQFIIIIIIIIIIYLLQLGLHPMAVVLP
jgi:hypothetical protein